MAWQGQPRAALLAQERPQQQRGQGRTGELGHDVGGDALPREIAARRERHAHRRIQVRARDRPHEQDDGGHHQRRSHHLRAVGDRVAAEPGAYHAAAHRHQDQQEGPEQLREQPPPLIPVVPEVELAGHRVRLPDGPQGNVRMTDTLLPVRLRFRGTLSWHAGHLTPHFRLPRTRHTRGRRGSPPPMHQPPTPQSSPVPPRLSSPETDEIPSGPTRLPLLARTHDEPTRRRMPARIEASPCPSHRGDRLSVFRR